MKRIGLLFLALILVMGAYVPFAAQAQGELIINVVEGRLKCGEYDLPLADTPSPVALGFAGGNTLLRVTTPDGVVDINLGGRQVAFTQRAATYVTEMHLDHADYADTGEVCPTCGRSTTLGNHTKMSCGHYGCLKPADHLQVCSACKGYLCNSADHSVCSSCKVRKCVHVDLECEYTRNPAPTPYVTVGPDGSIQYNYTDPSGAYAEGKPGPTALPWIPAIIDYAIKYATPSPNPNPFPGMPGGSGGYPGYP